MRSRARAPRNRVRQTGSGGAHFRLLNERALSDGGESAGELAHQLTVRAGDRFVLLRVQEIDWVEAAANYLCIHAHGERYLMRGTMTALALRLDPRQFARIHRSAIVNMDRVREIRPGWHGEHDVVLHDGQTLRLSRSYRATLLRR